VLLQGYYVIPNWHLRFQRILYWDKFSRPATTAKFGTSTTLWWFDADKAARVERARGAARDERQSSRNSPSHPEAVVTVVVDQ
jgi:microcin C transport system substrate-binding protein